MQSGSRNSMFAIMLGALLVSGSAASAQSGRNDGMPRREAAPSHQVQKQQHVKQQRERAAKKDAERIRGFRNDQAMKAPRRIERSDRQDFARPAPHGGQPRDGARDGGRQMKHERANRFTGPNAGQPGRDVGRPHAAKKHQRAINKFDTNGNGLLEPAEMHAFNMAKRDRARDLGQQQKQPRNDGGAPKHGMGRGGPMNDRAMRGGGGMPGRDFSHAGRGGFEGRTGRPMAEAGRPTRSHGAPGGRDTNAGGIPQDVRERIMKNHDTDGDGRLNELERRRIREMVEQGRREQERGPAPAPVQRRSRGGDAI